MNNGKLRSFLKNPLQKKLGNSEPKQKPAKNVDRVPNGTISFRKMFV